MMIVQKSFGRLPAGGRLDRIQQSKNYRDGSFQNILETPMLAEGASYFSMVGNYLKKGVDREPVIALPAQRTDLKTAHSEVPSVVWFGHSSYLIQIEGKNILIDPVLGGRASPFRNVGGKSYEISIPYTADDFPDIDLLIITHDHYDHLDYDTIRKLGPKIKSVYTSLGVGSHLAYWGIEESRITELDWHEGNTPFPRVEIIATPARHFSGRLFVRNKTLWSSFVLKTPDYRIFIGGDSGYDDNFRDIGKEYGPFDLAVLECGQYNTMWPYIHMMPEDTAQAALDLGARTLMPVHWGKFTLALHPWTEPIERVTRKAASRGLPVITPVIGEKVMLDKLVSRTSWWRLDKV